MNVIGVGFGRTGTSSLRDALDILGLGPTMHNVRLDDRLDLRKAWHFKTHGKNIPWSALTSGFNSVTDWPAVYYWKQMIAEWPDAPVILTVRPVREWLASMRHTIAPAIQSQINSPRFQIEVSRVIIGLLTFNDDLSDENMMRVYAKHVVDVRATVEPGRLLEFNVKDGWGPLCRFLDVPVPDIPFPHSNDAADFERRVKLTMMGNTNAA